MPKIKDLLDEVHAEVGADFVATVIAGQDGLPVAEKSINGEFDHAIAAANFVNIMKLAGEVGEKMGLGKLADNLIITDKYAILTCLLGDGKFSWGLIVHKDANLGSLRIMMAEKAATMAQVVS